jgi:hypothetical protein
VLAIIVVVAVTAALATCAIAMWVDAKGLNPE